MSASIKSKLILIISIFFCSIASEPAFSADLPIKGKGTYACLIDYPLRNQSFTCHADSNICTKRINCSGYGVCQNGVCTEPPGGDGCKGGAPTCPAGCQPAAPTTTNCANLGVCSNGTCTAPAGTNCTAGTLTCQNPCPISCANLGQCGYDSNGAGVCNPPSSGVACNPGSVSCPSACQSLPSCQTLVRCNDDGSVNTSGAQEGVNCLRGTPMTPASPCYYKPPAGFFQSAAFLEQMRVRIYVNADWDSAPNLMAQCQNTFNATPPPCSTEVNLSEFNNCLYERQTGLNACYLNKLKPITDYLTPFYPKCDLTDTVLINTGSRLGISNANTRNFSNNCIARANARPDVTRYYTRDFSIKTKAELERLWSQQKQIETDALIAEIKTKIRSNIITTKSRIDTMCNGYNQSALPNAIRADIGSGEQFSQKYCKDFISTSLLPSTNCQALWSVDANTPLGSIGYNDDLNIESCMTALTNKANNVINWGKSIDDLKVSKSNEFKLDIDTLINTQVQNISGSNPNSAEAVEFKNMLTSSFKNGDESRDVIFDKCKSKTGISLAKASEAPTLTADLQNCLTIEKSNYNNTYIVNKTIRDASEDAAKKVNRTITVNSPSNVQTTTPTTPTTPIVNPLDTPQPTVQDPTAPAAVTTETPAATTGSTGGTRGARPTSR